MATLKDVKTKINAVKKTKQITRAMNMVAASRLRGAQANMVSFRPYAGKFSEVLGSLAERSGEESHPLLVSREVTQKIHIMLCTSDKGLCGGFNSNLVNKAKAFMEEIAGPNTDITFTNFGRKGRDWCRSSKYTIENEHLGVVGATFGFNIASTTGRQLVEAFLSETYDEVYIIYSEFISMGRQVPTVKQILPIPPIETSGDDGEAETVTYMPEHICEPSPDELLGDMLPRNVYVQIYSALLETSTSEHAARMMAMDNASKACNDIIDSLTLVYNKARQAAITAELMDIVGGAEALRG
jgi:F-type H+-transporting ATPase subunit gamma